MLHPLLLLPGRIGCQLGAEGVPIFTISELTSESYTNRPLAGELMVSMEDVFILGISNPLAVWVISSAAEALGVVIPMPTLWENTFRGMLNIERKNKMYKTKDRFFILIAFFASGK